MSWFFSSDLDKFKLETQLKTLTHIVGEKQVGIKDTIKIISSLNASQKLLVSEVLKLVKLVLTVPATYKEKVDKLRLVEVANQFCFENEHRFSI